MSFVLLIYLLVVFVCVPISSLDVRACVRSINKATLAIAVQCSVFLGFTYYAGGMH